MRASQAGWVETLEVAEADYAKVATRYSEFVHAIRDTSDHARSAVLRQDSLLRMRIRLLEDNFGRASRRHLYNLKALRGFLQQNDIWMWRVQSQGMPPRSIRGSWEARSLRYTVLQGHLLESATALEGLEADYATLNRRFQLGGNPEPAPPVPPPVQPVP